MMNELFNFVKKKKKQKQSGVEVGEFISQHDSSIIEIKVKV